ncbi:MAG: glycosyltransferase [Bradyrhizobium sp.]|nr:MAG: glycosyltransferase [Bradyrhizobium sp.]
MSAPAICGVTATLDDQVDRLAESLKALVGSRPVALLDWPNYANAGDHFIWLGEKVLFRRRLGSEILYECSLNQVDILRLTRLPPDAVLVMHGGGNFGDLYPHHQRLREAVIGAFPDRRIIVMPQTIHFAGRERMEQSARQLKLHPDLHVMTRDRESLAVASLRMGLPNCQLHIDSAFALQPIVTALLDKLALKPVSDRVYLLRRDFESTASSVLPEGAASHDWARTDDLKQFANDPPEPNSIDAAARVVETDFDAQSWRRFCGAVRLFSGGEHIVTDRLHGHILALMMGKEHELYDNSYGKIGSFYDTWTRDHPLVAYRSNTKRIPRERMESPPDFPSSVIAEALPKEPRSRRLAIIIPYRNRQQHLAKFLPHLISYFQRTRMETIGEVTILVVEQTDDLPFNRGGLLNAGFLALADDVDYVCFHDVDYLPMWADYSYAETPTRIIWWGMHRRPIRVSNPSRSAMAPKEGLGAVTVISTESFRAVNGYSNRFFGWGFEDKDLAARCRRHGFAIGQRDGTFIPLDHDNAGYCDDGSKSAAWLENERRYAENQKEYELHGVGKDGLSSVSAHLAPIEFVEVAGLDRAETRKVAYLSVSFNEPGPKMIRAADTLGILRGLLGNASQSAAPAPSAPVAPATTGSQVESPVEVASVRRRISLCMIVKNEAPVIRRCLDSVRQIVDYWVIVDTGSTDGTQDIIREHLRDMPGELHERPWRDFAHNRSEALTLARPQADYSLIIDADDALELPRHFALPPLTDDSYSFEIRDTNLSYPRTQLVRNTLPWRFEGVLHEYLTCEGAKTHSHLPIGIRRRHDGARRRDPKTYEKDAAILERALASEANPHLRTRYTYYLGQSYRDCGRIAEAAEAYAKRAGMGGWEEEAWSARLHYARCLLTLKDEAGFLREALAAFNQRPHRAEPLYDLARFYRERGMNDASVLFSEPGLATPRPQGDTLFIENTVYHHGLKEEYSIAANYARDPARKSRGFDACNWLALSRQTPSGTRGLARHNLRFYARAASETMPSFKARPLRFALPDGAHPLSSSAARDGDQLVVLLRATDPAAPLAANARNFLLHLDAALDVASAAEILPSGEPPALGWSEAGDAKLFSWRGALWRLASLCDPEIEGRRRQSLARIEGQRLVERRTLAFDGPWRARETWTPFVAGDALRFVALIDPLRIVDADAQEISTIAPPIAADAFRAATPAVGFDGGWLMLVEEELGEATEPDRVVHHRFVRLDETAALRGVSRPFFFRQHGAERAAGLAWRDEGKQLVVSFNVGDSEAWLATIDAADVRRIVANVRDLPFGALAPPRAAPESAAAEAATSAQSPSPEPTQPAPPTSRWTPSSPMGGTELMVEGLRARLGAELDRINLTINDPGNPAGDKRPCVVWMHHDVNQSWVQWCGDAKLVDQVARFVFVSDWQRQRYLQTFALPAERCAVLRNATEVAPEPRSWRPAPVLRCAYTSTPFRGLSVLLDAWRRVNPSNAELHVWSSMALYREDDAPYRDLYARAQSTPGVTYHGVVPNPELRQTLREMHFLTYPSIFPETSCLSVMEAMAAGCRIIVPALGALPETTAGFARIYESGADAETHVTAFADALAAELEAPWGGAPERALDQQRYCASAYDWTARVDEWRRFLASLA